MILVEQRNANCYKCVLNSVNFKEKLENNFIFMRTSTLTYDLYLSKKTHFP